MAQSSGERAFSSPACRLAAVALTAVFALLAAACGEEAPQAPDAGGPASVSVTATIEAAGDTASQQQGESGLEAAFEAADVAAVRVSSSGGSVLADREVGFDPGAGGAELSLELTIEDDRVPATVQLALRRGRDRLFEGAKSITLVAGETSTAELGLTPVPDAVSVPEGPVTFTALGDTAELDAAVVFATGDTIPGLGVSWSSSDSSVADVFEDGTVVADAPGEAEAVASHEDLSASVALEVDPEVATVALEPDSTVFTSLSGSTDFSVQVTDANGNPVEDEPVTWTSTDRQVAAVDAEGVATARGDGAASVVAEAMGTADTASVTVDLGPTGQVAGQVGRVQSQSSALSAVAANQTAGSSIPTNPVGGVEVRFLQGGAVVSRTKTASDGTWTSPSIPPGVYTLEYASPDLVTVRHPDVEIAEGTTGSVAEVPMVPASDQPGTVAGSVLNSRTGGGVAGAAVEVHQGFQAPDGPVVATGTAGADGSYEITGVEAGTYTITGAAPDFARDVITGVALGGETFGGQDLELVPPPEVTISSPIDGASFSTADVIPFRGSADDPEQGSLTGDALVWTSDQLADPIGTGESFTTTLPAGEHTITLTATNDRGASGSASVGVTVEGNTPPTASINTPNDGDTFTEGESVPFEGTATDEEDGDLFGESLVWESDLDGQIGTGRSFTRSDLSVGTHQITLTATDSDGATGTDAITITVNVSWAQVNAGGEHTCGVATDGTAYCWGNNSSGQVGDGTTGFTSPPVQVAGGITFVKINSGSNYTCGVATNGTVHCWGENSSGELGNGTTVGSTTPVQVTGGISWQQISTGNSHTCGIATDGTAYCWGFNGNGQLGDGTTSGSTTPVQVAGGISWDGISAGDGHSCGVAGDGTAYCWGENSSGELGNGTTAGSTTPVQVTGGISWQQTSTGQSHSCGVAGDGTAYCWGFNGNGALGDGTETDSTTPVEVSGGINWQQLDAGSGHTCGVANDSRAYCWGFNLFGQLGDGTFTESQTPVQVVNP